MILYQKNIFQEAEYNHFIIALREKFDCQEVEVIPFTNNFNQEVREVPTHCFGSTRFIDICRAKGFPVYKSFAPIEPYAPEYWLNWDGWDCKLGEIDFKEHFYVFVKPYREKLFNGCVVEKGKPFPAQIAFSEGIDENEELVRVSPYKKILKEYRFFVKDGKVLTASLYKKNGQKAIENIDRWVSPQATVENMIARHGSIDKAFVVDLATWEFYGERGSSLGRPRIVEFNNFNSSGFYRCDVKKIVDSL